MEDPDPPKPPSDGPTVEELERMREASRAAMARARADLKGIEEHLRRARKQDAPAGTDDPASRA